jgi:hypothetical protein
MITVYSLFIHSISEEILKTLGGSDHCRSAVSIAIVLFRQAIPMDSVIHRNNMSERELLEPLFT